MGCFLLTQGVGRNDLVRGHIRDLNVITMFYMHVDDLKDLISQIDKTGKTEEPIYYKSSTMPWEYTRFNLDYINCLLKGSIELIEEEYAPFWWKI